MRMTDELVTIRLPKSHWIQIVDDIENMCGESWEDIEILANAKVVGVDE